MPHVDDEKLLQYRFETLDPADVDDVASHLRTCSECAMRFAELGQGLEVMSRYESDSEVDEALTERVLEQVRTLQQEREAEQERADARAEAEAAQREAEVILQAAAAAADQAGGAQPDGAPAEAGAASTAPVAPVAAATSAPAKPDKDRPGFWAWLGLSGGASLRMVRLVVTMTTLAGAGYVAGGSLYYSRQKAAIDTQVSGEDDLIPGTRGMLLVRVINRLTKHPVASADVQVSMKGPKQTWKLFQGKTDKSGTSDVVFDLPDVKDGSYRLEVVSRADGERDTITQPIRFHRAFKVHLSTDKPLYQPGQTIHIRTLVLQRPTMTPPRGKTVILEVIDPKKTRLARQVVPISKFGVGVFNLELADDLRLGPYRIRAVIDGAESEMKVKVARYALPKFKISIKPEKAFYLAGETFRAKITGRYFFGKPLELADVRVVLIRPNGMLIGDEIKGKTGRQGEYSFSAELPDDLAAAGRPQTVTVEVALKDAAGQEERKQHGATVTRELLHMELLPDGGKLVADMKNTLYLLTTTPDGKPVAGRVTVTPPGGKPFIVRTHRNGLGVFTYTPKGSELVKTHRPGPSPPSSIRRRPGAPDRRERLRRRRMRRRMHRPGPRPRPPVRGLAFRLDGEDREGRKASRQVVLTGKHARVMVGTDQAFYRPGETAQVAIQAIAQYTSAVVEGIQEGQTLFRTRIPLSKGKGTAEIDLPPRVTGTIRLDVQALDAYEVRSEIVYRKIVVAEQQGLKVTMSSDRSSFRPGKEARLQFSVTDAQGNPKAAAIGLSVVDESVFALAASRPALARAFFLLGRSLMKPRHNLSAPEALSRGAWGAPEQQAGQLLLSMDRDHKRPRRFIKSSYQTKAAGLMSRRSQFEQNAYLVALSLGLVLALVLVVAAARRLPAWAGAILLAIGAVIALMIPVGLTYVLLGLAVGAVISLAIYGKMERKFGYPYLLIPLLGVGVAYFLLTGVDQPAPRHTDPTPIGPISVVEEKRETERRDVANEASKPMPPPTGLRGAAPGEDSPRRKKRARSRPRPASVGGSLSKEAPRPSMDPAKGLGSSGGKARKAPRRPHIPRRAVRVRRYFPETMYVHPELVTDEQGKASLTIPLADSITEWRISALASSADGKLGAMARPLKVFQDFFVDLDMPVALVRGDEVTIPVAVYNYLSAPQTVRLEIKAEPWFRVIGPKKMHVVLPPGGVEGKEVRIQVLKAGKHRLSLRADGTKLSDALARQLLVSEAGEERSDSVSGTLTAGEVVKVTVQVPDAAVKGSSKLLAKLFPSRLSSAMDGLESSLRQPHGCFEQTSSSTYPNVLIYNYLKRSGKLTPALKKRALRFISLGYQRLLGFEAPGGGFGWFRGRRGNPILTAYGLMEFSDMAKVYPVDPRLIDRTQKWLISRQTGDGSWSGGRRYHRRRRHHRRPAYRNPRNQLKITAYVAWALSESGYRGPALNRAMDYLSQQVKRSSDPYVLSLALATFSKANRKADQTAARDTLLRAAIKQGKRVHFRPVGATVYHGRGRPGTIETTALAAQALSHAKASPEVVLAAVDYLAASRDHRGTWYSTQATILALRTLLLATSAESDQQVTVRVNGVESGAFKLLSSADRPYLVDLGAKVRHGVNVVELRSEARTTFQVVATYTLPWRSRDADENKPLVLKVNYARTKVGLGGVVPVEVEMTYRRPEPSGMVLLALGLPAGLSPIVSDLKALVSSGQVARYEIVAGKMNLYLDELSTGAKTTMKFRLKARTKVKTKGVGSLAYLFYHPEIRATAPPATMTVN